LQAHAGVRLTRGAWQIEPALGLTAISLAGGPAGETTGGALAEQIAHQSINSVQSLLGVRVGTQVAITAKLPLYAHALVGWQHEFADTAANTTGMFQLAGSAPFIVSNTPVARDAARLGIGLDGSVSQAVTLYVSYQASLGAGTTAQYLTGGVRVTW
jgi:outer membrane autotransporter protein